MWTMFSKRRGLAGLLLIAGSVWGQSTGDDPEADKRTYLMQGNPTITINAPCDQTCVGGVLWPTLVQVKNFLVTDTNGGAKVVTGGSEIDHHADLGTGRGHLNGYKVDLQIANQANTYNDPLSQFITSNTLPTTCRVDFDGSGAPQYFSGTLIIFAMEYPVPLAPAALNCPPATPAAQDPNGGRCCHWDIQSSYGELDVTPLTLTLKVGESMAVSPVAKDQVGNVITAIPWMFDYDFPSDTAQRIASIDSTGAVTGTAGSVIGVSVGSSVLLVSEGPYYGLVQITVNPADPPGGGPVCSAPGQTNCWQWDPTAGGGTGGWLWISNRSNPNPPGPPPNGNQCPGNSSAQGPCWIWDPTANGGSGAWIFVPPSGGSGGTTTTPPITPVQSLDPNAISGETGAGAAQYISASNPAAYTVFFGNDPSATAPAQRVVITDQLNPAVFNLSTLVLGPITFPGQVISPPSVPLQSLGNFSAQLDLRPTTNLLVNVTASLNPSTGVLSWVFQSLDPATGLPPANPLAGFLPPGGEGSTSLLVRLQSSLTTGAVVNDQAIIVFDNNPPIPTSVWSNTIDATPPVSHVNALAPTQTATAFSVSWTGSDVGAGVQDFTVSVSDNGGPFIAWQHNVTKTSALFTGIRGHTYGFYTIARDLVGNVEGAKTAAEGTTKIVTDTTPPVIVPQITGTLGNNGWYRSNVTVGWSVTDPESGIASSSDCVQTTLTTDTAGVTLTCTATNGAGLMASVPITMKIDQTAPGITGMPAPGCSLWPPNGKMIQVATVTAADALSGLAPNSFQVSGTSNEPPSAPEISITPNGSGGYVVALQADRLGNGTGRIYTLTATAADVAGNIATVTATCTVPHDQGQ
jgi:hypothetical protein